MPRKSAAALSVVRPPHERQRPEPPEELTAEQAIEWRAVVERLPAEWFPRESHQLLVTYCRHVVKARMIEGWIQGLDVEWVETEDGVRMIAPGCLSQIDKLTAMAEREGRALASLATRMRITQQSRYQTQTAHTKQADPNVERKQWQHVA